MVLTSNEQLQLLEPSTIFISYLLIKSRISAGVCRAIPKTYCCRILGSGNLSKNCVSVVNLTHNSSTCIRKRQCSPIQSNDGIQDDAYDCLPHRAIKRELSSLRPRVMVTSRSLRRFTRASSRQGRRWLSRCRDPTSWRRSPWICTSSGEGTFLSHHNWISALFTVRDFCRTDLVLSLLRLEFRVVREESHLGVLDGLVIANGAVS